MIAYVDSSLLVSVYVTDAHSAVADERMALGFSVFMTPLHRAEFANSLAQQVFRRRLSGAQAQGAWGNFQHDCGAGIWTAVEFPHRAWDGAVDLARQFGSALGVRTLDSLHVACALELKARCFWTFDDRQRRLAKEAGLDVTL